MAYVLKRGSKTVSVSENRRHYVVSFTDKSLAHDVMSKMNPCLMLHLKRGISMDVTEDVAEMLFERVGKRWTSPMSIEINTTSSLYVPKMSGGNKGDTLVMETIGLSNLYMMPFDQNLGLIFPHEIVYESKREMVYNCNIVEPSTNARLFGMNLDRLMSR